MTENPVRNPCKKDCKDRRSWVDENGHPHSCHGFCERRKAYEEAHAKELREKRIDKALSDISRDGFERRCKHRGPEPEGQKRQRSGWIRHSGGRNYGN